MSKTFKAYNLILFLLSLFTLFFYLLIPFKITFTTLSLIGLGILIDILFFEDEEFNYFSLNMVTLMLIIIFSNIQSLLIALTIFSISSILKKALNKEHFSDIVFSWRTIFNWSSSVITAFFIFKIKLFFVFDFSDFMNILNIAFLLISFVLIRRVLNIIYLKLNRENYYSVNNVMRQYIYLSYTFLATFLTTYVFIDRGFTYVLLMYVFIAPFQKFDDIYTKSKNHELNSLTDSLTGVYNVRYLRQIMSEKISKKERFYIILLDLDKFKQINDTYGHSIGDLVLKKFATVLKNSIRENDVVIRYGGDEFCIIVSEENSCSIMIERFTEKLKDFNVLVQNRPMNVKSSIGFKYYNGKDERETEEIINELIRNADKDMYKMKKENKENYSVEIGIN